MCVCVYPLNISQFPAGQCAGQEPPSEIGGENPPDHFIYIFTAFVVSVSWPVGWDDFKNQSGVISALMCIKIWHLNC